MSHDMRLLVDGCAEMGWDLEEKQVSQFEQFLSLLLEWNDKFNLTAITDPREIMVRHFLDSLSVLKTDVIHEEDKVLDIGSGAGLPGIPIKIMVPGIRLTLVDAVQKKTVYLQEVIRRLGLEECRAIHARAEDLAKEESQRQAYDVVLSRAVAELRVLAEYCLPFARTGGFFIAHKGPGAVREMEDAERAVRILGGQIQGAEKAAVPYSERSHILVVVKKTTDTPAKYPRSAGKPKKSPL